jgi:hypothetical protein
MCRFHVSNVLVQALRAGRVCRPAPRDPTGTGDVESTKAVCDQGGQPQGQGRIRHRAQNGREKDGVLDQNRLKTASRVETLGVWTVVLRIVTIALLLTRRFSLFEWYQVPWKALGR